MLDAFVQLPLPLWLCLSAIALLSGLMQHQLFYTRKLARQFWLSVYLRPTGGLHQLLSRTVLLRWLCFAIAVPLSMVTYISIYSYRWGECLAIAIGILLARYIHETIAKPVDSNIAGHLAELAHLRIFYWLSVTLVLASLASAGLIRSLWTDHSELTPDQIATQVIGDVHHPVRIVQHCVRTLNYGELQILRVRDTVGWPYGWLIYLFFLAPNAIPAFGLVTIYSGSERIYKNLCSNSS